MKSVKNTLNDRTGEIGYNKHGSKMTIIKYNNSQDIVVQFENGYEVNCAYVSFKKHELINPYDRVVCGVGYLGEGEYAIAKNKERTREYSVWDGIIQRCYNTNKQKLKPSYIGCSVCEEWLNFQNFAEWYNKNYYEIGNERMQVDKDILHKGNKIYSPENCMIVPNDINCLFIRSASRRGDYPIGVSMGNSRLRARVKKIINGKCKEIHIGYFNTVLEAFNAYKREKEKHIKEVADEYKDKIPDKLYQAMYNYIVEIDD